jgi:hypothetical protein
MWTSEALVWLQCGKSRSHLTLRTQGRAEGLLGVAAGAKRRGNFCDVKGTEWTWLVMSNDRLVRLSLR